MRSLFDGFVKANGVEAALDHHQSRACDCRVRRVDLGRVEIEHHAHRSFSFMRVSIASLGIQEMIAILLPISPSAPRSLPSVKDRRGETHGPRSHSGCRGLIGRDRVKSYERVSPSTVWSGSA